MAATLLDGSVLEGGGQLVRNAIAFSALLSRPVSISNVRSGRAVPGLKPQHVAGLFLAGNICDARLEGAEKGSNAISFHPSRITTGNYSADPGTAGSTTLLLQLALPCLLFADAPSSLTLRGGTNATSAPQIDYTIQVFLPFLARHMHLTPTLTITRRGYFPRGGGEVAVRVTPVSPHSALPAVTLTTRGAVTAIHGRSFIAGTIPAHMARTMADAAESRLVRAGIDRALIDIRLVREHSRDAVGSGCGIMLWAETESGCVLGGSAMGEKGTAPNKVGKNAAEELARNLEHGGCVDEYLQDQIIIFLALAKGKSTVVTGPLTMHTRTAIWLAEQLTNAKFHTEEEPETGRTRITCDGIGLKPPLE